MVTIIQNRQVVPNVHELVLELPEIARKAKPGQFLILMGDDHGEKIPLTIADWNATDGTVSLFYLEAGLSTRKLTTLHAGGQIFSVTGPLGNATEVKNFGKVFLGGGCYGIGGIYPVARALKEAGNEVWVSIEARSAFLLYGVEKLEAVVDKLLIATSDGSRGEKGKVQNVFKRIVDDGEKFDRAYFMGCTRMMKNCSDATRDIVPTRVWLNSIMLDGTGMCGCCRVLVGGKMKFACVDGPEFDAHEVDWNDLFTRKSSYMEAENLAYQFYTCGQGCQGCQG
jgi:NAD(P)H-flavin reductase